MFGKRKNLEGKTFLAQKFFKKGREVISLKAKVIKAMRGSTLQEEIDEVLEQIGDDFVDLKLAGAFDGKDEVFVAIILYK